MKVNDVMNYHNSNEIKMVYIVKCVRSECGLNALDF